ncbi:MAG: Threonine dehydratase [uncultured Thermomicrobiales bacterium]|uniref:Threonine dehydratase n=1 Tax=uncultured Thermomicrobiales bacterium TaxID=1645740 RepID=A0A6J4VIW9_9BACT|nr:MAG: Threonine dehydratase [uncultured Thermomicrobiales bacterium]
MVIGKAVPAGPALRWDPIPLTALREAQGRTRGAVLRTPLVRLDADELRPTIVLKLESLQPIRSFKLRGAYNAMAKAGRAALAGGVWTASAGNMAQAVAWSARALGVACTVYVPATAPRTKIANVQRYGGTVVELPVDEWVDIFRTREREGAPGVFVHPYSDPDVMAGNGVIGLEILEDLPDVNVVVVPWGGGGLACGIASAVKALRPRTRVYACEIDTGAPLAPSLATGHPVEVPYVPSFADGIGGPFVNAEMFDLARRLLDGAIVVSREQTADAARLVIERNRVVPEGAAATAVAAALTGEAGGGTVACLVSGGNVDTDTLLTILGGGTPA